MDKKTAGVVAHELSHFLADTAILYVKTLNFHWNMEGPEFFMYHRLLEEQYKELADSIDMIAEHVRTLGVKAPGTMREFLEKGCLKEAKGHYTQNKMVAELAKDHTTLVEHARIIIELTGELKDPATSDLLVDRVRSHEKSAWLLRSHTAKR